MVLDFLPKVISHVFEFRNLICACKVNHYIIKLAVNCLCQVFNTVMITNVLTLTQYNINTSSESRINNIRNQHQILVFCMSGNELTNTNELINTFNIKGVYVFYSVVCKFPDGNIDTPVLRTCKVTG